MRKNYLDLLDYRHKVADIYRQASDEIWPVETRWEIFRRERDRLFADHPQSALSNDQKTRFEGLVYYPYSPEFRFELPILSAPQPRLAEVELDDEGLIHLESFGEIHFRIAGCDLSLTLFWIQTYGGGLFLPFRDATNQSETYEGGRYLLDTIKHADLGQVGDNLVIDFNFAYNPSCAYHSRWKCPLAPADNWLEVPIRAGEKRYPDSQ